MRLGAPAVLERAGNAQSVSELFARSVALRRPMAPRATPRSRPTKDAIRPVQRVTRNARARPGTIRNACNIFVRNAKPMTTPTSAIQRVLAVSIAEGTYYKYLKLWLLSRDPSGQEL